MFPTNKEEKKEEKGSSSLPHYMTATVASLKKQKPLVKKEEKEKVEAVAVGMNGYGDD